MKAHGTTRPIPQSTTSGVTQAWVLPFSNQEWTNRYSDDTPMIDVFAGLVHPTANSIQGVVRRAFQHSA